MSVYHMRHSHLTRIPEENHEKAKQDIRLFKLQSQLVVLEPEYESFLGQVDFLQFPQFH